MEDKRMVCESRVDEGLRTFKDSVCGTIRTIDSGGDKRVVSNENQKYRIRKLTPKECWRLMGFVDEDIDKAIQGGVSNTQLYKQAGNSIVVDVLYYIYKELYKAMPYLFEDIKLCSCFSGIGAFEKGLDRLFTEINSGDGGGCNPSQIIGETNEARTKRLGNVYGEQFGNSFGGNVWDKKEIAPTLKTTAAASQQHIIECS